MQIIENWADVEGLIQGYDIAEDDGRFYEVVIQVLKVKNVGGYRNFLQDTEGHSILVRAAKGLIESGRYQSGATIVCRVRKATSGLFFFNDESIVIKGHEHK